MILKKEEQIFLILQVYSIEKVKEKFLEYVFPSMNTVTVRKYIEKWFEKEEEIKDYWEKKPHLKFMYVLNLKLSLPTLLNFYYYDKADEFLIDILLMRFKYTPLFDETLYNIEWK